jgi:nuclease (SNase domain protein)
LPHKITSKHLEAALTEMGVLVVEYSQEINDPDIESLLKSIHKLEISKTVDSFYHIDKSKKIVCIKEGLNEKDKVMLISHEIGHIYCDNAIIRNLAQNTGPQKEKAANDFANYLLNNHHRLGICIISIAAIAILLVTADIATKHTNNNSAAQTQVIQEATASPVIADIEVVVTKTGQKYHKPDCNYVKDKANLIHMTLDEAIGGGYEPCEMCKPDNK